MLVIQSIDSDRRSVSLTVSRYNDLGTKVIRLYKDTDPDNPLQGTHVADIILNEDELRELRENL